MARKSELFNYETIKHLKPLLITIIALAVVVVMSTKIPSIAVAADGDYKIMQKSEIDAKIKLYSDKYDVPYSKIYNAIDCETGHTFNPQIQSNVIYNFSSKKRGIEKGTREESYGLVQIHLPDHPQITREQATDVDFSVEFMAKNLSEGRNLWSCIK